MSALMPIVALFASCQTREASGRSATVPMVCDISNAGCQAGLVQAVSAMFDLDGRLRVPEIRFVSAAELTSLNRGELDRQPVSAPVRSAMIALGLLTDGGAGIGPSEQAVYRSQSHDVLISFPDRERATLRANVALVHELIHAAQAQQGLFTRRPGSFDRGLAWRARLEGEAVVRSFRFKSRLEGLDPNGIEWPMVFGEWSKGSLASIHRARSPLALAAATLPYARGALWYESLARSASAGWPEQFAALLGAPGAARATPDGANLVHLPCSGASEELGALSLLAFVLPESNQPEVFAAAQRLRSDLLCVGADGSFTWQLVWPSDAGSGIALVQRRAQKPPLRANVRTSGSAAGLRMTISGGRSAARSP